MGWAFWSVRLSHSFHGDRLRCYKMGGGAASISADHFPNCGMRRECIIWKPSKNRFKTPNHLPDEYLLSWHFDNRSCLRRKRGASHSDSNPLRSFVRHRAEHTHIRDWRSLWRRTLPSPARLQPMRRRTYFHRHSPADRHLFGQTTSYRRRVVVPPILLLPGRP